jgi:hypothetical protein
LLCLLAYCAEWHMRQDLAALLFDDDDKAAAAQRRTSVVAPAQRSPAAEARAHSKRNRDDLAVHSLQNSKPTAPTRQALLGQQRHPDPERSGQEQVLTSSFA